MRSPRPHRLGALMFPVVVLLLAVGAAQAGHRSAPAIDVRPAGTRRDHPPRSPAAARPRSPRARAVPPDGTGLGLISEPDDGLSPLLGLIDTARTSIDLTMYELSDPGVEAALGRAARRGVSVRVLLNGRDGSEPGRMNAAAIHELRGHGVAVRLSPGYFALTHRRR